MKISYSMIRLILLVLLVAACTPGSPNTGDLTSPTSTVLPEQKSTISALETLVAALPSPFPTETLTSPTRLPTATLSPNPTSAQTATPAPSMTASLTPTLTPIPTLTFTPTPTPKIIPCNRAAFIADVTIPDGSPIAAGATFTKTWRLRNNGTCTWTPDYSIVFVSGNKLGGPAYRMLGTSVLPGQTIDISLVLIAPGTTGMYKGSYLLADASGVTFGVGVNGRGTFFVSIQQGTSSPTSSEKVTLSTNRAHAGDALTVTVSGFPANSEIDYRVGRLGEDFVLVYDGFVESDGTSSKTITIPDYAINGEYWVVKVTTTSLRDILAIASQSIYITDTYTPPNTGQLQVDLSTTQARPGELVTVYVRGFPANAKIDFRVGEQGKGYSVVYDGAVGSNGSTIQLITIPSRAIYGQYWVVQVITTNLVNVVTLTSQAIYITQ